MILRDYQEEIKKRLYAAWESGCRSVMCQMPTGTGKTVVLAQVIKETLGPSQSLCDSSPSMGSGWRDEKTCRVLVVAHRKEILEQIRETLAKYGLGDRLAEGSIVVESIQKISRGWGKTKTIKIPSATASSANLTLYEASASSESELSAATDTPYNGILTDAAIADGNKQEKQSLAKKEDISNLSIEGEGRIKRRRGSQVRVYW